MSAFERTTPRLVEPDTEDNLQQQFLDNNWTDGLPIVLPTEKRVAAMLAHTSRKPDEIVGRMQPTEFRVAWEYTVEKVAVNAVMAGARPEYFPVILALAASQVSARGSTSSSASAMVVVNGPIRHEIEMNCGIGAMGPYNHANATIGRAYGLLSQNLQGGSVPGETFMGSQGNNYTYNNITFAENEERSPWEPLHVQKGFKPARQRGEHLLRLPLDHVLPRPARKILARARARHARRHRRQFGALPAARSAHRPAVHRPWRLRQQGQADPFHSRDGADAGRALLGPAARAELRLSLGDVRQGADGDLAQGQAGRTDPPSSRRATSTSWWSAAKPTAIGASWAPSTARPSRSTSGGDDCGSGSQLRRGTRRPSPAKEKGGGKRGGQFKLPGRKIK